MRVNFDKTRADATGRWFDIFRRLGIEINETGKHGPCPNCQGQDRFRIDKTFVERGSYYCSGCGPGGSGFDLIMKVMNITITEAMEAVAEIVGTCEYNATPKEPMITPEVLRKIFCGSSLVSEHDPATRYFKNRGLSKIPPKLRYHPACWESETQSNQKAILSVFTGPDNIAITMHRTYIDEDGNKLNVKKPKKILPALKKMTGGACRLFPIDDRCVLGLAEGIETAIAASEIDNIPVWAATTAVLMESFEPPKNVKSMVVYADNDQNYAGQKAAYTLANRLAVQKRMPVKVKVPSIQGDFLDILNNKGE